jgi:dTDP-4-amino-4,6-dideoxygalactose transaminase
MQIEFLGRAFARKTAQATQGQVQIARTQCGVASEIAIGALLPHLDRVIAALASDGIETTIGTYALHAEPFFVRTYGHRPGDRPRSWRAYRSCLSLPLHGGITEEDVELVVERLLGACAGAR